MGSEIRSNVSIESGKAELAFLVVRKSYLFNMLVYEFPRPLHNFGYGNYTILIKNNWSL